MGHRKKTAPDSVVLARNDKNLARCDSCGHFLWRIAGDHLESTIDGGIAGWHVSDDGTWRPTEEHRAQRKLAEARLQDPKLPPAERRRTRELLKQNRFSRGAAHTGKPAPVSALATLPRERNTSNKAIVDLSRARLLQEIRQDVDGEIVLVLNGTQSGMYERKQTRDASELAPRLVRALQLPAKVECPQCEVVNLITDS